MPTMTDLNTLVRGLYNGSKKALNLDSNGDLVIMDKTLNDVVDKLSSIEQLLELLVLHAEKASCGVFDKTDIEGK